MLRRAPLVLTAALLLVLVACGGDDDGGEATTTTAAPTTEATTTTEVATTEPDEEATTTTEVPSTTTTTAPTTTTTAPADPTEAGAVTPGEAAQGLYQAWKDGDAVAAAAVADPAAIATLFARPYSPPDLEFVGCNEDGDIFACAYYYEGGARIFRVRATSTGQYRVAEINDIAD